MWRLVITSGVQQGRALRLHVGTQSIGRSPDSHFYIPDPSVSAAHCEIIFSEQGVRVRDLNSTNGTFVDDIRITEAPLSLGQTLQVGTVLMRLDDLSSDLEPGPISIPALSTPVAPPSSLTLPDGTITCAQHAACAAEYRCTGCGQGLCASCVRTVRRQGGQMLVFCTLCSAACEAVVRAPPAPKSPMKRLLVRVAETLRLPFKR